MTLDPKTLRANAVSIPRQDARSGIGWKWLALPVAWLASAHAGAQTLALASPELAPTGADRIGCVRTLTADVVALDTPLMFNRLGAQNINWMTYALKRDVVKVDPLTRLPVPGAIPGDVNGADAGNVAIRPDKRIRPLVLRVAAGDCLQVTLLNLLTPVANPFNNKAFDQILPPINPTVGNNALNIDDQVADRHAGFHVLGMQLVNSINDDSSYVGRNPNSLVPQGGQRSYTLFAEREGAFPAQSYGAQFGGDASAGQNSTGLFGMVIVEPKGAAMYRGNVTEEEMRLAIAGTTPTGQPIINYEVKFPNVQPWIAEGRAGLPVLNMIWNNEIVHTEIDAIVAFAGAGRSQFVGDGRFPADTYPLESVGLRNPTVPNRLEPFRDFASLFHDENSVAQAFPKWYLDPVLGHTLHGVRDTFMINYGSGGIGTEIIANRLLVGPMHDCAGCAYEEFFLTSFTVGDPAMLTNVPANFGLENCTPALGAACIGPGLNGPKADFALYPADSGNVHHSYTGDFVKFRNTHNGKEQHIFHLHNHQWLFNANDDNANYLDAQGIGPGSGYTYEINFGGSGNRNKSSGDAIFHCHFYPHFAQGMWYMWRIHDTFELGTQLAVSGKGFHTAPFALQNGTPAVGARALPDGEIVAGVPIPAVVPLPGKAMAPMPAKVTVVAKVGASGAVVGSNAKIDRADMLGPDGRPGTADDKNPGYPFWIAGIEDSVGQRPPTPPLDMATKAQMQALKASGNPLWAVVDNTGTAEGFDGGLPRHTIQGIADGGVTVTSISRLDFSKVLENVKPVYFPEEGTDAEQVAMWFHSVRNHPSTALLAGGATAPGNFVLNGTKPVAGGPFSDPCVDDAGNRAAGSGNVYFGAAGLTVTGGSPFNATTPRVYKGANVQLDAVFNKVGYHYPQQRIEALWEDVNAIINKQKAPEPFVLRMNTFDCTMFAHSNLYPGEFELDDYQVRTPTDIVGQHIHLPKWDLTTTDGAANGWNYEDGTLAPSIVRERIHAINHFVELGGAPAVGTGSRAGFTAPAHLAPQPHPFLGAGLRNEWLGARVTLQRWFADPVVNTAGVDRGLGIIFTHDHYGPSTHQQIGLYSTVLTEPAGSKWVHNETGEQLYTRADGGPTSWQVAILPNQIAGYNTNSNDPNARAFREFYFEYSDFQHAYQPGMYVGAGPDGRPHVAVGPEGVAEIHHIAYAPDPSGFRLEVPPLAPAPNGVPAGCDAAAGVPCSVNAAYPVTIDTFRDAINPSFRQQARPVFPDIVLHPPFCPGPVGVVVPRPCPEAISADDPGMLVLNYRNEPLGLRVFDPNREGPDGKRGSQAAGLAGDLAFAMQSRTDRAIPQMNRQPQAGDIAPSQAVCTGCTKLDTKFPPPINVAGVAPGDPFTPMMRTYAGDLVRMKIQAGAHEHEHNISVHGLKWLQGGSGHGQAPNSGWRNGQAAGISEQFTMATPVEMDVTQNGRTADYAYSVDNSQDGWWTGMWGLLRNYSTEQPNLVVLPGGGPLKIANREDFDEDEEVGTRALCPRGSGRIRYSVSAVLANEVLRNAVNATIPGLNDIDPLTGQPFAKGTVGAALNRAGGTLVYNPRPVQLQQVTIDVEGGGQIVVGGQKGPLHDPTAVMYVLDDDLIERDALLERGDDRIGGKLRADAPVEPVVLHANAGDCIVVRLTNRLPAAMPDLAGFNTLLPVVRRDAVGANGVTWFENNLIAPSAHVGMHLQLVEYDVTRSDGVNVGLNPVQTAAPGESVTYVFYAGDMNALRETRSNGRIRVTGVPIEFGGSNISPADKIKQGQKGMVGALVVVADRARIRNDFDELPLTKDHQVYPIALNARRTRAQMDIRDPIGEMRYRDTVAVYQKGLNMRFGDGQAVPNLSAEGIGIPEDSHDAGQKAINYGTEPAWFRFALPANAPFGNTPGGFGAVPNAHELFSNNLVIPGLGMAGEPATPVFTAAPGQHTRMRVLEPTGAGRGTTFTLHGHVWQRDPYVCLGEARNDLPGACNMGFVGSRNIGVNPQGFYLGSQESVIPMSHFDIILPSAGGKNAIPGDYLINDTASFGRTDGLWGILRVQP